MRFADRHPDFATIERHIREARLERSVYIAEAIASGLAAVGRFLARPEEKDEERRHIASQPFLRRSIQ